MTDVDSSANVGSRYWIGVGSGCWVEVDTGSGCWVEIWA